MLASTTAPTGEPVIESRSPQAPDDVIVRVPCVHSATVSDAGELARAAQREWWLGGAAMRAEALRTVAGCLRERLDEAVTLVTREVGKPTHEARAEVTRAVSIVDYYAQQSFAAQGQVMPPSLPGMLWTERRPRGLACLITPWNFPIAIPLWKASPALVAGNAVLLKPAPDATASALWLRELVSDVLPKGLFQVLPGGGATGSELVETADVVSFTGSEAVGREVTIRAARSGTPVQAEMGGQNAAVILPDADAEATAAMVVGAAMGYAGQKCTATRRAIIVGSRSRQRHVRDAIAAAVESLVAGDPTRDDVALGPVISQDSRDRVFAAQDTVRRAGGRVLARGSVEGAKGWYVPPTVVEGVAPQHPIAQEELFGPFMATFPAGDSNEAVRLAESVRYGLVTSVHGRDAGGLLDAVSRIGSGLIKVNAPTTGVDFYAPFGGERDSGYGPREQGEAALDFYATTRTVTFAPHA